MAESLYSDIPGLGEQERDALRRQRIAEAMLAQSQQSVQPFQQAGRYVVPMSPTQGIAKVVQAFMAGKRGKRAEADLAAVAKSAEEGRRRVAEAYATGRTTDPKGSASALMSDPFSTPAMQRGAGLDYQGALQAENDKRDAANRAEDRKTQLEGRMAELQLRLSDQALDRQSREQIAGMMNDTRRDLAALVASNVRPEVVTDAAGNTKMYDREGNLIKDLGAVGKPTAEFQKTQAQKKKLGGDLDRAISELETATADGGLIDQSTGSGAGALADKAAGFFGVATEGAVAAGKMAPIYDLALKMVPRFEGPQSDKDTQSYREAAGQLANPAVPNEQKKAAGREILRLMKERRDQFISKDMEGTEADAPAAAPSAGVPAGVDPKLWEALTPEERALWP